MPLPLSTQDGAQLEGDIERWAGDPVAFVYEVFGPGYENEKGEPLVIDRWQERGLRALVRHEPGWCAQGRCDGGAHDHVAAKACKGPGKTAWKAWIGWWRLLCKRFLQGFCVSITGDNLKANLWKELAYWQSFSPLLLALFEHKAEEIVSRDHPKLWWLKARAFPQEADKEKQAETLAGLHADNLLVLLDEVGSFPQGVLDAAKAIFNVKGVDALLVVGGNATSVDGPLYRICTEDADSWFIVTVTGDPDDPDRSPRIDIDVAREQIRKHGRRDHVVMVNILGQFPPKASDKLLGVDEVFAAQRRDPQRRLWEREPMVWGLDVAAGGLDSSVLFKRQGLVAFLPDVWHSKTDDALADQIVLRYHEARAKGKAPKKLFVDKGGVGRGVWSRLVALLGSTIVIGVDFGGLALEDAAYADRRTEMWCLMAEWVRECGSIPDIAELRIDLTGPVIGVSQTVHKGTRRKLESKDSMKKRGLKSPDEGDALALTFAAPVLSDAADGSRKMFADTAFDPIEHLTEMADV